MDGRGLLESEGGGHGGDNHMRVTSHTAWDQLMVTSREEEATADKNQEGPGDWITGGGSVRPVVRTIRDELSGIKEDVRNRSGSRRSKSTHGTGGGGGDAAGVHSPMGPKRRRHTKRECCSLWGCSSQLVRRPGTRQIIGYSTDAVTTLACFRLSGTVLASRFIWIQSILLAILSLCIFAIGVSTEIFFHVSMSKFTSMLSFLNGLCTFLLSLFVSLTLARWWSLRYVYSIG
jgi:hypothetical protein